MKQTHDCIFMLEGAGFHDRTGKDFNQSAADCIDDHADQNPDKGITEQIRNDGQARQSQAAGNFRNHNAAPIADGIDKLRAEHINQQLRQEKRGGDQRDLSQGYSVIRMEPEKQERSEIGADCLGDECQITGSQGFAVILLHFLSPCSV